MLPANSQLCFRRRRVTPETAARAPRAGAAGQPRGTSGTVKGEGRVQRAQPGSGALRDSLLSCSQPPGVRSRV